MTEGGAGPETRSIEQPVSPPVIRDDELIVPCANSGCPRTTTVSTTIDAVETNDTGSNWRLAFVPRADGQLEVGECYCPEHRIGDSLDRMADVQDELAQRVSECKSIIDDMD